MKLSEIMTTKVVSITPEDSLDFAIELFERHTFRYLPVIQRGALVSMLSRRDLSLATGWLTAEERRARGQKMPLLVGDIMRDRIVSLAPELDVDRAASMMVGKRVGAIPILEDSRLVGIVTSSDILAGIRKRNPRAEWGRSRELPTVTVSDFMQRKPDSLEPSTQVAEAADICLRKGLRHLAITDRGVLVGLVSEHELRFELDDDCTPPPTSLSEVMVRDVITIGPDEDLAVAADSMIQNQVSGLPVVDDESLVGFLTDQDVIQFFTARFRVPAL